MAEPETAKNPLQVAVVGAGPSGFYATEALIKSGRAVHIDMIERLPAPFGLVRNGVAPDHPKLKQAIGVYQKIAQNPEFNFIGNVTVGRDVTAAELRGTHDAVIYTCGSETDRKLGVAGEDLPGSHTATELVGWYNGHPDYRDRSFDFSHETAVIIGQGNVAADAARILAKSPDELKNTDIAAHALEALAESRIREIHVVGRRGPAQAKFTSKELREFLSIGNCDAVVDAAELELNPQSEREIADKAGAMGKKNLELFRQMTAAGGKPRVCRFTFLKSPLQLEGAARLERVVFAENSLSGDAFEQAARPTGETFALECGLLFRSIGYRGVAIEGVPFDEKRGVFPNDAGRMIENAGSAEKGGVVRGVYTAGWIKRGPSGIIGTNRACAVETVGALLDDWPELRAPDAEPKPGAAKLYEMLDGRGVRHINYAQWQAIDAAEIKRGEPKQKPREKFTRVEEMLAAAGA